MPEALLNAKHGDVALALIGRDASAGQGTFSYMAKHGPGTLWEAWDCAPDSNDMRTGGSANHIMFAGGPGIFIHQAAGVSERTWRSADAEVAFELDGPTAAALLAYHVRDDHVIGETQARQDALVLAYIAEAISQGIDGDLVSVHDWVTILQAVTQLRSKYGAAGGETEAADDARAKDASGARG